MLRLIAARLVGDVVVTVARPFIRIGVFLLLAYAIWALPGALWRWYVDPNAGPQFLTAMNWFGVGLMVASIVASKLLRRRHQRRAAHPKRVESATRIR